jgi:hypothetical protein
MRKVIKTVPTAVVLSDAPTDTAIGSTVAIADTTTAFDGEALAAVARGLAAKVTDVTEDAIEIAAKGKEDWQGGPIAVLAGLQSDFGDELNDFPEPDSDTGNNPDKFKMEVTDTSGKTAKRDTSFYLLFADNTKAGQAIQTELAYLKRANNLEAIKDGIPAHILSMSPSERDDRIKFLDGRRATVRSAYKKAMRLYFQFVAIGELTVMVGKDGKVNANPELNTIGKAGTVGCDFIYGKDEEGNDTDVINSPAPIVIWEQPGCNAKGEARPITKSVKVSIGKFLNFDAKKALENGGTYAALLKTIERAPKKADGTPIVEEQRIETVDTFTKRFVEVARFMDEMQSAENPKELGKLYNLLRHKDADDLITMFVGFRNYCDDVCDELGLDAKYADIIKKQPEMELKKASK